MFCIAALLTLNLRRSTAGLALTAIRHNEIGAYTLGINVVATKVLLGGGGAFLAALGGGFLASCNGPALPSAFTTLAGLVWLAVLVTVGVRSVIAAGLAGLVFAIAPAIFLSYLPNSLGNVPTALFGLGAIMVVRNPDGVVAVHARQAKVLVSWLTSRRGALRHRTHPVTTVACIARSTADQGDRMIPQ